MKYTASFRRASLLNRTMEREFGAPAFWRHLFARLQKMADIRVSTNLERIMDGKRLLKTPSAKRLLPQTGQPTLGVNDARYGPVARFIPLEASLVRRFVRFSGHNIRLFARSRQVLHTKCEQYQTDRKGKRNSYTRKGLPLQPHFPIDQGLIIQAFNRDTLRQISF